MALILSLKLSKLKSIMNYPVFSIEKNKTLADGINLMVEHDAGSVIITDEGKPKGILTERDLLQALHDKHFSVKTKIHDLATTKLRSLAPDSSISDAFRMMQTYRIRRVPIINKHDHLIGIVTERDVIKATNDYINTHSKIQWGISIFVFTALMIFFLYLMLR
ncbi:MAG: CBS domain-containing protein [Candidatus Woesearchaeota archaeon]